MKFHEAMKALRLDIGHGLREFNELTGIPPVDYVEIAMGRKRPTAFELAQILRGFSILRMLSKEEVASLLAAWDEPFVPETAETEESAGSIGAQCRAELSAERAENRRGERAERFAQRYRAPRDRS